MSALEELIKKKISTKQTTLLEDAILEIYEAPEDWYKWAEQAAEELSAMQARIEELEKTISKFTGCNHGLDKINSDSEGAWCMRCMDIEHAKILGECRNCGGKLNKDLYCTKCKDGYKE